MRFIDKVVHLNLLVYFDLRMDLYSMQINVTLKQIEAFLAVADSLSFSHAAKSTHLSQPALSANIRHLEETIGAKLFDRDTRKVKLTPVGIEFSKIAVNLLSNFNNGFAHIQDFVRGKHGRLIIAAAPSLAARFIPEIIARFINEYPDVDLHLHDVLSDVCVDMVRAGTADIAFAPMKTESDDLVHHALFSDHLVMVCAADHPLAKYRTVKWSDMKPFSHIVMSSTGSVRQLVNAEYELQGLPLRPLFEVEHVGTLLGLIATGIGVGELPISIIQTVNLKGLAYRRISDAKSYRRICAITSKTHSPSPAIEPFVRICLEMAQKLSTE